MTYHGAVALFGLGLIFAVEGKLETGTIRLGGHAEEDRWAYLSKFGFIVGDKSTYEVRFRLRPGSAFQAGVEPVVDLEVFLDEDWDYALTLQACRRASEGKAKRTFPNMHLGSEPGEWGPWVSGKVYQKVRPHIWYFAASSCHRETPFQIDFEVRSRQFDGSELGFEMRCMPMVSATVLACLTAFLACFGHHCWLSAQNADSLHPVIRALCVAVVLQWGALALEVLHLWVYRSDGVGSPVADALSGCLDGLSQVVSSAILVAIAHGYSLAGTRMRELSSLKPMASAVATLHVALVLLDKLGGEASYEHHENGGALGLVTLAARLTLFAWFTKGIGDLQGTAGLRLHAFLRQFQVIGSAYLLSYPALFLVVQVFAPYLRHPLLQVGLMTAQTCSALWLAGLFLSKGFFYELSTLSSSLLPSAQPCLLGSAAALSSKDPSATLPMRRRGRC